VHLSSGDYFLLKWSVKRSGPMDFREQIKRETFDVIVRVSGME
jgi:hypothetical protein